MDPAAEARFGQDTGDTFDEVVGSVGRRPCFRGGGGVGLAAHFACCLVLCLPVGVVEHSSRAR
ncbi:Uncharacterised protein [Mycobacterium tuberculosis]|nr:Uncharacterised protein [Mycobacterium tuberculosis]CKS94672.1 Uncharacterised protein [Mycobacterium tuberculosis]CKT21903.1 Uncharacterised protein [Mycobacterium tuberculosis]CNN63525.1 Uncharacterised protein [Mycobacterium tuberculosis]